MAEQKIRLEYRKIDELIPYEHNAKLHPPEQIRKLVRSLNEFGRIVPAGIAAEKWHLSERELALIAQLGGGADG